MSDLQITLDFSGKLPASAQLGIQTAVNNADIRWKAAFSGCILAVARRLPEFTVDDVLAEMDALPEAPTTHNGSAAGGLMRQARRDGVIRPTDRYRRSIRTQSHGNLLAVWESKYFNGNQ